MKKVLHISLVLVLGLAVSAFADYIPVDILDEIKELNDQLRKRAVITPEMEVMIGIRNSKIQEAIDEIEGSYKYARHIQETFLPDDLYVRECFPESFIFFRPKDIVSGDFYFFSKRDHHVIFAAADCTGHGIPGALLSTIGYGAIDQAVNQLGMTDPSVILQHSIPESTGFSSLT